VTTASLAPGRITSAGVAAPPGPSSTSTIPIRISTMCGSNRVPRELPFRVEQAFGVEGALDRLVQRDRRRLPLPGRHYG